jgi:serine/threonine-protein kinase
MTLGGFRIEQEIGAGGMGKVFLATQLSLDRPVALKILPSDLAGNAEQVQRFFNEVHLLARLEHPNIVTAHEAGEDGGVLFMAMAYVKGESLESRLSREGTVPEREALRIAGKVSRALAYAWNEHRLLHRDIKPSNILMDARGEPKLADLGLSVTVGRAPRRGQDDTIAGTPNYMSPEQVRGEREVDFRTDMYSLGATLYHMLTGQLPFAAETIEETLQRQVTEQLPDPRVYAPGTSDPCVALLEMLMAKDPHARPPSWEALIADLDRVRSGKTPLGKPLARGDSILLRLSDVGQLAEARKLRLNHDQVQKLRQAHAPASREEHTMWPAWIVLILMLALTAVGVWYVVRVRRIRPAPPPPPLAVPIEVPSPEQAAESLRKDEAERRMADVNRRLREADEFARAEAADLGAALARYRDLEKAAAGTGLEGAVRDRIAQLANRRRRAADAAVADLRTRADALAAAGDLEGARRLVEEYAGAMAKETAEARRAIAEEIRRRMDEAARLAQARALEREAWAALLADAASAVLRQDFASAQAAAERAAADRALAARAADVAALRDGIAAVARTPEIVLESIRADTGKTVILQLTGGADSWEILGVAGGIIEARRPVGMGFVARSIAFEDLSLQERYRRLGADNTAERWIMRGLLMMKGGNPEAARKAFDGAGNELGAALASAVAGQLAQAAEASAQAALDGALRAADVTAVAGEGPDDLARRIRRTRFAPSDAAAVRSAAAALRAQHGATEAIRRMEPVVKALEGADPIPREVDPERIDAALTEIERLNPSDEALLESHTMTEQGLELELSGNPTLADIGPLRDLPLYALRLDGTAVRDLGPLKGHRLARLDLSGSPVQDLSPLEGVPLRELVLRGCPIESLAGLKGAPLTVLDLRQTRVRSLSPLLGAPLKRLMLGGAPIETLRWLAQMPIEDLSIEACEGISDLRPLKGMPLRRLVLRSCPVQDLTPLQGAPLEELRLGGCNLLDLRTLAGLRPRILELTSCGVTSLDPLKGLAAESLELADNPRLSDLSPLRGAAIRQLDLRGTNVEDLSPLEGMPLEELDLTRTAVSNLAPLSGLPLTVLLVEACPRLSDVRPLMGCRHLTTLVLPSRVTDARVLRRHPSLQQLGFTQQSLVPAERFWRLVAGEDAGPREAPSWP